MTPDHAPAPPAGWARLVASLVARALLNPRLALDLITLVWAYRARDWYRTPPFLPVPPAEYLAWRLYTAYGAADAVPPADDVVRLARWRRKVLDP
jgi:hypothetical protein